MIHFPNSTSPGQSDEIGCYGNLQLPVSVKITRDICMHGGNKSTSHQTSMKIQKRAKKWVGCVLVSPVQSWHGIFLFVERGLHGGVEIADESRHRLPKCLIFLIDLASVFSKTVSYHSIVYF